MPLLCVADAAGLLGNRLFLFAHLIACAREHGLSLMNPLFGPYADQFTGTAGDLLCRYPARPTWVRPSAARRDRVWRWFTAARPFAERGARSPVLRRWIGVLESGRITTLVDPHAEYDLDGAAFREEITSKRLLLLKGALHRAHRSLPRHAAAVREHLLPVPVVVDEAAKTMARVRAMGATVVGVHVRQGDYRTFVGGKFFFSTPQYRDLMVRIAPLFGEEKVVFLVCSDQPQDPVAFAPLRVVLAGGSPVVDLHCLASCDFIVGPPSTFSGWGSFFGCVPRYRILDIGHTPRRPEFAPAQS